MRTLTATELSSWLTDDSRARPLLLDVREPWEYQICHIEGSHLIPMNAIPARFSELDRNAEVVVICHHGGRSAQVCMFLERQGFPSVINLVGGVAQWAAQIAPDMPRY